MRSRIPEFQNWQDTSAHIREGPQIWQIPPLVTALCDIFLTALEGYQILKTGVFVCEWWETLQEAVCSRKEKVKKPYSLDPLAEVGEFVLSMIYMAFNYSFWWGGNQDI